MSLLDNNGGNSMAIVPRGVGYVLAGTSGAIAAAAAQDSIFFAMRMAAAATAGGQVVVESLRLSFTAIAAFTTPITAGRRLAVYRAGVGSGDPAGGLTLAAAKKSSASGNRFLAPNASLISVAMIANAGPLTGVSAREANPLATLDLVHVGAAGVNTVRTYEFQAPANSPIILQPGELLVVSNPVAMDAGGTWQLSVDAEFTTQGVYG